MGPCIEEESARVSTGAVFVLAHCKSRRIGSEAESGYAVIRVVLRRYDLAVVAECHIPSDIAHVAVSSCCPSGISCNAASLDNNNAELLPLDVLSTVTKLSLLSE